MTQDPRIDSYFEDLPAYALGALDPDARLALEAHLEGCPVCSAELEELADASSALAALVPAVEPPPGVKDGLMSRARSIARPNLSARARVDRPHRTLRDSDAAPLCGDGASRCWSGGDLSKRTGDIEPPRRPRR